MIKIADTNPLPGFLQVTINKQPVELYKILKFEGLVGTGGEAKTVVASGLVRVNNNVVTEKRKKIVAGDTIEFADTKIQIVLTDAPTASPDHDKAQPKQKQKKPDKKSRPAIAPKPGKH